MSRSVVLVIKTARTSIAIAVTALFLAACQTAAPSQPPLSGLDGTWRATTWSDTNRPWTSQLEISSDKFRGTIRCEPFQDLEVSGGIRPDNSMAFAVNPGKRTIPGMAEYHVTGKFPSLEIANLTGGRCGRAVLKFARTGAPRPAKPAVPAKPTPRAERPTYTLGERWIRTDDVYELIRIEEDRYIFSGPSRSEIHLTKNLGLAKSIQGPRVWEFDPPPDLTWPLEVGKWGVTTGTWRSPRGGVRPSTRLTWSVDAYEEVEIAGATLKTFRITTQIEPQLTGGRWELTMWYAPEVRQFVKATGEDLESQQFSVVAFDRPEPLTVVFEEPKDQARMSTEEVRVSGKVTSGRGVARVSVALNGTEVSVWEERPPKNTLALEVPIKLNEGRNVVVVTAADPQGTTSQEARILFLDRPPPAVAAPLREPEPRPVPVPAQPAPAPAAPPTAIAPPAEVSAKPPLPPADRGPVGGAIGPPFQLVIAAPQDQARVDHEDIALAGRISGGKGVSQVVVTLNGAEVSRGDQRMPQRSLALNVPLKLREGQNMVVVSATEGDEAIHQEIRIVHYEKFAPLTIAFRYPEDRARVTEEASVVAAVLTSSRGVAKVSVTLNGTEVFQQDERAPQKSLLVTVPVTLREGPNTIGITASEPDRTVRQEVRTVIFDRPKAPALPPAAPGPPPPARERWAVVIGVGQYDNPAIPRLRYSVADAEAIYATLIGPAGFPKDHVLLLTDTTDKRPTLRNIKWALGTFLARSAKKDDTVLVFFAGHGAPEVDPRGIERDGLAKYLIPIDADSEDLYSTGLPMDEIQTVFGRIEAERMVVFLDTCYSGAAGGRTFSAKKTRAGTLDDLFLERLTRAKGRAIITASRPAEVSIELSELGHGIFTYYLVQGLKGAADLNRDGIVSLQELYEYVEQQVSQKSRAVGGNQHPMMKGELEGVLPLVNLGGR